MKKNFVLLIMLLGQLSIASAQSLSKYQKPFSRYTVNPDSCIRIEHTSGSLIFIESKAIVSDAKKVDILYREFLTPLDMLVHGIQMHVDIAGERFPLESTGMFELYALDGSDTLKFNPEKRMEVRLNGPKEIKPGVEGYKYNRKDPHWESYTSMISNRAIGDDSDLWGSSIVDEQVEVLNEDAFSAYVDTVQQKVFQSMEIDDFGFYNYDRIIEGLEYVYIQPNFVATNKKEIKSTIYVVYNEINSVFYFSEYNWAEAFFLIKDEPYKMFTIAENGQVLKLESFPDITNVEDSPVSFALKAQKEIPTDNQSLAKLTGIQ